MKDKTVYICDDDGGILNMLAMVIQSMGLDVVAEQDSRQLYKRLEEGKPKLLIIDLWMPDLPGDAIIQQLKLDQKYNDLYILGISASQNGEQIAMTAGADEFLAKPFDLADIVGVVDKLSLLD